jgi:dipeptidyl-peptidase-4
MAPCFCPGESILFYSYRFFAQTGLVLSGLLALAACAPISKDKSPEPMQADQRLTLEAIFKDEIFEAEAPGQIRWLEDGSGYTTLEIVEAFRDAEPEQDEEGEDIPFPQDIVFYDPATLDRSILISAQQMTPQGEEQALEIDDYHWSEDGSKLLIYTNSEKVWRSNSRGDYWVLDIESGELRQLGGDEAEESSLMFAKFSPDASHVAYVREDNIYVESSVSHRIEQLTTDASDQLINGVFDWVYEEEFGIRDGFRWSPDGSSIAYWQLDTSAAQDFILINNTDELYPVLTRFPYPKVGEENSAARVGVVSLATKQTVWAQLPGVARDMYIPRMDWGNRSDRILVQHLNRKQDRNQVYFASADTGELSKVLLEQEETYIESANDVHWFDESDDFTWISERSGWRHVYRVGEDGTSIVDLTPGEFDVVELDAIDETVGWLYFTAAPGDVVRRYLYRTRLDGSGQMERVTPENYRGTNSYQVSKDAKWAIHEHSTFQQPPQYRLVSLPDHTVRQVLEDNQELIDNLQDMALGEHEFFQLEAQDGWVLDGYIMRPPQFDPARRYPIITYVYGEPWGQTARDVWGGSNYLWHALMTQRGFLVSSVDNRGTRSPRGREWRRSIYGAVGILASRDQSDALKAMGQRWDYVDLNRVGVWGHSGGGSMTLNMMFRYPEQYDVGVSRAPVPDQRLYDTIYQERYSGLLEDHEEGYHQGSPINFAGQLQGKLLLIHGTGDDNVHYQGTERLINELVKHNRQFDLMSYPNRSHSIKEGEGTQLHMQTMMTNYFAEHLQP